MKKITALVAVLILVFLGIRFYFVLQNTVINTDGIYIIDTAKNLLHGKGYVTGYLETIGWVPRDLPIPFPQNEYTPVVPILMIISHLFITDWFLAGKAITLLFGVLILLITYYITKNLSDKNSKDKRYPYKSAMIALLMAGLSLPMIMASTEIRTDIFYSAPLLISVYLFIKGSEINTKSTKNDRNAWKYYLGSAIFAGLSFYTRMQAIAFPLYFLIATAIYKRKWKAYLMWLMVFALIVSPWLVKISIDSEQSTFPSQSKVMWLPAENYVIFEQAVHSLEPRQHLQQYLSKDKLSLLAGLAWTYIRNIPFLIMSINPLLVILFLIGIFYLKDHRKFSLIYLMIFFHFTLPFYEPEDMLIHFVPILPLVIVISAFGFMNIVDWLKSGIVSSKSSKKQIRKFPDNSDNAAPIPSLLLLLLIVLLTVPLYFYRPMEDRNYEKIGLFLKNATSEGDIVSSTQAENAYFADRRWVQLPYDNLTTTLEYFKERNIHYFVLDEDVTLHPDLRNLLEAEKTPKGIEHVYTTQPPIVKVYKID